jgi:uncharacterized coiled-coil protein SlyX
MAEKPQDETLADLERVRAEAERDFLAQVELLEARVAAALSALRSAESVSAEAPPPPDGLAVSALPAAPAAPSGTPRQPDQVPWPGGGGPLRGLLNAVARWGLRDYLAVLDARHEALAERSRHLESDGSARLEQLAAVQAQTTEALSAIVTELRVMAEQLPAALRGARLAEATREALNGLGETVDLVSGIALRLRVLMNAKDAEVLRRSVGGPDRKVEAVMDLLNRRQEALLAELVGRRQELDELIESARSRD